MQRRHLLGVASRGERDEELALFHEMHRKEDSRKSNAVHPLNCESGYNRDQPHFMKSVSSSTPEAHRIAFSAAASMAALKGSRTGDDLLTADLGKNDYDWLLTPPGTPLVNPLDHTSSAYGDDFLSHAVLPNLVRSLAAIKTSRLSSSKSEPIMRKEASNGALLAMRPDPAMRSGRNGLNRSASGVMGGPSFMTNNATSMTSRRTPPAPGSRPTSRPTTPTKRPISSSTPVSRPTTPTSRPKVASTPASRPTTPTRSRAAPTPLSRPSTPSSRPAIVSASRSGDSNIISSSMTTRGSIPSRPTTPMRRPAAPPQAQPQSVSATATRSSSVSKGRPVPSRSTPSSRGSSPITKPNAWQQLSDIPGFSLEPPPNLRTSLPSRPSSNSRGASVSGPRPGASSTGATMGTTARTIALADMQMERPDDASTRRPASPSLARGRSGTIPSSTVERQSSVNTLVVRNGSKFDKSPGAGEMSVKGARMVDRMVPSRRPFPSSLSPETALSMSQIRHVVRPGTPTASKDNTGFGRSTPRKSTELPSRHMELRQSSSNGLRSLVRNIPTSSLYSVRPAGIRVLANSSPMASSSNASSDYSMSLMRDAESSEMGEELFSEVGSKASPASQSDSFLSLLKNAHTNKWLGSPESKDGTPEYKDGTPEYKDGTPEYKNGTPESNQEGTPESKLVVPQNIEKSGGSESALVCRHGCVAANCDLCNMKIRLQKLNEKCRASLRASLHASEERKDSVGNGGL